jgi:hypothetical protein
MKVAASNSKTPAEEFAVAPIVKQRVRKRECEIPDGTTYFTD